MNQRSQQKCVMIIAGEASGDLHGANLVRAMRARDDSLFFFGVGGDHLREAGVRVVMDASRISVVGLTEVLSRAPDILRGLGKAKALLKTLRPDLLILIDFPDFNFRVAAHARKQGVPVLYYISPQIWAWRKGRVKKMARLVDHMAVILPFEEKFYRDHHIPVTFVGHPIADAPIPPPDASLPVARDNTPVIGLLPGSRGGEIARLLPIMLDAARLLADQTDRVKFLISVAPSVDRSALKAIVDRRGKGLDLELREGGAHHVFRESRLVVAASGTVALEGAIYETPMIIIYKFSMISAIIARMLIRIKYACLVNIIADREIAPELMQERATPVEIAETAQRMLADEAGLEEIRKALAEVKERLGGPGASGRVADVAMGMLKRERE
ncbi:MAG: lipid-A-disaccharide synthase [Desulfobacterales bacterium]|nr:lipid-A-disaccharide synthase [Desulfobacterales bacterium]